ncbi:hypothetical protein BSLG_005862 [Batrachochytrium salamandrivorans]|nr:hypothetical protein BSLG_005862 [Batrachochytrium salamandrivorans]
MDNRMYSPASARRARDGVGLIGVLWQTVLSSSVLHGSSLDHNDRSSSNTPAAPFQRSSSAASIRTEISRPDTPLLMTVVLHTSRAQGGVGGANVQVSGHDDVDGSNNSVQLPPAASRIMLQTAPPRASKMIKGGLSKEITTIGRKEDNDIPISDGKISKYHAEVLRSAEGYFIRDKNSSNGAFESTLRLAYELSKMSVTDDIGKLLAKTMELIFDVIPIDRGEATGRSKHCSAFSALRQTSRGKANENREICFFHHLTKSILSTSLISSDACEDPMLGKAASIMTGQIRSVICVPLVAQILSMAYCIWILVIASAHFLAKICPWSKPSAIKLQWRGGIVDKYVGDALMCFGTLVEDKDAEYRSVVAALEFQEAIRDMNTERMRSGKDSILLVSVSTQVSFNHAI